MKFTFFTQFIDQNKLGGWVRAGVGAAFVAAIAKWPVLGAYMDPAVQVQLAAAIATIVVGAWSQLTKTDAAKITAVAELTKDPASPVQAIITTATTEGKSLAANIDGIVHAAGSAAAITSAKS